VSARPSTTGSPSPTIPAFVWTLRNSHRGLTRKVSSLVIFSGSFLATGASLPTCASTARSAGPNAAQPSPATAPAIIERRVKEAAIGVVSFMRRSSADVQTNPNAAHKRRNHGTHGTHGKKTECTEKIERGLAGVILPALFDFIFLLAF